jgi:hypothetical protein
MIRTIIAAMLLATPAAAGTVTCIHKTYDHITRATIKPDGKNPVLRLWAEGETRWPMYTIFFAEDGDCIVDDVPMHFQIAGDK